MIVLHALKFNERIDRLDWNQVRKGPIFAMRGLNFADLDIDNLRPNQLQAVLTGAAMWDQTPKSTSAEQVR